MTELQSDAAVHHHDPAALRLRRGLRIEVLDDEVLALDPLEGVVHRLQGVAADIVAARVDGRAPVLADDRAHLVVDALLEAGILADAEADVATGAVGAPDDAGASPT